MSQEVIHYVTQYGYYAIFVLIFLLESGIPEPIPNELVLLVSGYMVYEGVMDFPMVIAVAMLADCTGTNILYTVFYFFGKWIMAHKPRWVPIKEKSIQKYSKKIAEGKMWTIYIGRISPFIRGYTSVIAGLLHIKPKKFEPIVFISALTWSCAYVGTGYLLGPYWKIGAQNLKYILPIVFVVLIIIAVVKHYMDKKKENENGDEAAGSSQQAEVSHSDGLGGAKEIEDLENTNEQSDEGTEAQRDKD